MNSGGDWFRPGAALQVMGRKRRRRRRGRDKGKWGGEGKENKSVRTYWGSTMQSMAPLIHMSLSHTLVLLPFPVPHVQGMLEHVALREQVSINFD